MRRKVIHIGANKTGSTTLQRCLFAASKDLLYLGEDCTGYEKYKDSLNSLVSDDDYYFDERKAKEIFNKFEHSQGERTFVYSNEDIMTSRVPAQCARRLHEFLPHAEILVVVRNQLTAIPSFYANHGAYLKMVPRRYWRRYVSFDDWMGYCTEFIKYSPLDSYFYYRIIALYASLFGREKIHVLLYEHFVNDKVKFIGDLCGILEIDKEEALGHLQDRRERRRNTKREFTYHKLRTWFLGGRSFGHRLPFGSTWTRIWNKFLEGGPPANGFMSDEWRNRIVELYREDNMKLARAYDLPLKELNYPMP